MKAAFGAALLSLQSVVVEGWAPLTHSWFACRQVLGDDDAEVARCLQEALPDLIVGDGFPDAFVFGSIVVGSNCEAIKPYHNHGFASFLLRESGNYSSGTGGFNATAFSLGYVNHMTLDAVGFYSKEPVVAPRNTTYLDWLHVWQYMNSIDAYLASTLGIRAAPSPVLSAEGAAFVAATSARYREVVPDAPALTAELVQYCAKSWQQILKDKGEEALRMPEDAWQDNLVYFSNFGAATWQEAVEDLQQTFACAADAWQFYVEQVRAGLEPFDFEDAFGKKVDELFASGDCVPRRAGGKLEGRKVQGLFTQYADDDFPDAVEFMFV